MNKKEYELIRSVAKKQRGHTLQLLENIFVLKDRVFTTDLSMSITKLMDNETEGIIPSVLPYEARQVEPYDIADFPELPEPTEKGTELYLKADLVKRLAKLAKLASKDTTRPVLTGMYLKSDGVRTYACATDGYILGIEPLDTKEEFEVIVPAKVFAYLVKLNCDWKISIWEDQVRFENADHLRIDSKVISGRYPDVEQVVPQFGEFVFDLDKNNEITPLIKGNKDAMVVANKDEVVVALDQERNGRRIKTNIKTSDRLMPFMFSSPSMIIMPLQIDWEQPQNTAISGALLQKVYYKEMTLNFTKERVVIVREK